MRHASVLKVNSLDRCDWFPANHNPNTNFLLQEPTIMVLVAGMIVGRAETHCATYQWPNVL